MTAPQSILSIESVSVSPAPHRRVRAVVNISGYQVRVSILLHDDGPGATVVEDPWLLYWQVIPHQLVMRAMMRIGRGEVLSLPVDFGAEVGRMNPPFRLPGSMPNEPNGVDDVDVQMLSFARRGSSPARVDAKVRLDGRCLDVEAEVYAATGRPSAYRFFNKSVSDLTAAQYAALCRVLTKKVIRSIERARERAQRRRRKRQDRVDNAHGS